MRLAALIRSLPLLLLLAAPLWAQDPDRLVLEPGVLELPNIQDREGKPPIYAGAYFSPYENLDQRLIAALRQAKPGSTVYMSYYSISYDEYPKVFRELQARGVTVRLNLYEKEAVPDSKRIDDDLVRDGFDVGLIPNLRNPNGQGSMHTKFTVVNDELVVTGSANLSASASLANHEHIVVVQSATLAERYIDEWNEQRRAAAAMHDAMTPEELEAFHASWEDPYPEDWTEGDPSRAETLAATLRRIDERVTNPERLVKTYFSPEDQLDRRCRTELRKARKSIKVAMYTFVNGLVNTLVDAARRGVKVEVIADDHQQAMEFAQWVNDKLEGEPNIRFVRANNQLGLYSSIHHKYAIIDDEVVVGGSYNWTGNATRYNDENLIVVRSKAVAERFAQDFAVMLQEYDPSGPAPEVTVPGATTRVLFAVAIPFEVPRDRAVFVRFEGPDGAPGDLLELRYSRSLGQNWIGSTDLPRGEDVRWRVLVAKKGSLITALEGEAADFDLEEGEEARVVVPAANGLAQILHERWRGAAPSFE